MSEVTFPTQCEECGTHHDSEDSDSVYSYRIKDVASEYDVLFCLNCIDPPVLENSNFMKKVTARLDTPSSVTGFLGTQKRRG